MESEPWQHELAHAVSDPVELLRLLDLDPARLPHPLLADPDFSLRVPRYFVDLMHAGDATDPLLAQVLPLQIERSPVEGYSTDPVGDQAATQGPGILKKYPGRALMITTGACAVHCRYCFRRHFPYQEQTPLRHWQESIGALRQMSDVSELILSGGDPLTLSDQRLQTLLDTAEEIPQLRRLRIHTRLPVVLPPRITQDLARLLGNNRLRSTVVIHANHPNEITDELAKSLAHLRENGVTLLNQSVLLKSVNDDADILATLSESLFDIGVLPYYLHVLDPVDGAAHFDLPEAHAIAIERRLRARLPGYLVPKMVREVPGHTGKTPLGCM
ncbi:MAG: EF-P beta-lysylation protein EpmB [Opitutales bacterium]|nr:EF-P beta-lysylation protein EpmB [Opitutales bacterium]